MFAVDTDDTAGGRGMSEEERRQQVRMTRRNEVAYFQDYRSCGSCEPCWRVFGFDLAEIAPPVMALNVRLENGQRVYFNDIQWRGVASNRRGPTGDTSYSMVSVEH